MDEIRIGSYTLKPGRQLAANGERVALGKRALDIVSALAAAKGEIVTKDELLDAVWHGAIVEENALQVHMVALRKALGSEAERLKTIRGVGYQLKIDNGLCHPEAPQLESDLSRPARRPDTSEVADAQVPRRSLARLAPDTAQPRLGLPRRWVATGLVSGALLLAGGAAFWTRPAGASPHSIRVEPLASTGGEQARLLGVTLHDNIIQDLNQSGVQIASAKRVGLFSAAPNASEVVHGAITQTGGRLHADIFIDDAVTGTTLWSKQFERDLGAADKLSTEASAAAARTIFTIRELDTQQPGLKLSPDAVALFVRGEDLMRNSQVLEEGGAQATFEQLIARAPRCAAGHAQLAMALASDARYSPVRASPAMIARSKAEARKAIAIAPSAAGAAYDALYNLSRVEHPDQLARAEDVLLAGMEKAPLFAFVWMRECRLLTDVGRGRAALPFCERALALHPFAEPIVHYYARALVQSGEDQKAKEAIERAFNNNPEHRTTRYVRFAIAAFGGRPAEALALLDDPVGNPDLRQGEAALLRRYLRDAGKWSERERRDLAQEVVGLATRGEMAPDMAVVALSSLGQLDDAFRLLGLPQSREAVPLLGTGFLFDPDTAPLRADPRFWRVAADLGLARYWITRGKWPDMCSGELDVQFCKAQAARALSLLPAK